MRSLSILILLSIMMVVSGAYEAAIEDLSVSPIVPLNGYVSGSLRLINTLNDTLDDQDCSVSAYHNESGFLIKSWDTTCRQGGEYIDLNGDPAYTTTNCPLTDSAGNYFFTGRILESEGFEYGLTYRLEFVCNMKSDSGEFYIDIPNIPRTETWIDAFIRYSGYTFMMIILLAVGISFMVLVVTISLFILKLIRGRLHE